MRDRKTKRKQKKVEKVNNSEYYTLSLISNLLPPPAIKKIVSVPIIHNNADVLNILRRK